MVGNLNSGLSYFVTTVPFPKTPHKNNPISEISAKNHDWKSNKLKTTTNLRRLHSLPTQQSLPKKLWEEVALPIKYHRKKIVINIHQRKKVYLIIQVSCILRFFVLSIPCKCITKIQPCKLPYAVIRSLYRIETSFNQYPRVQFEFTK